MYIILSVWEKISLKKKKYIYIYINNVLHSYKNDVEATEHPLGPLMAWAEDLLGIGGMETLYEASMPGQSTDVLQVVEIPNHDTSGRGAFSGVMCVLFFFIEAWEFVVKPMPQSSNKTWWVWSHSERVDLWHGILLMSAAHSTYPSDVFWRRVLPNGDGTVCTCKYLLIDVWILEDRVIVRKL